MEDVFISSVGTKHYITDKDLRQAYRDLIKAGYSVGDAQDLALDICIARFEASVISISDLVYQNTRYAKQLSLLATLNTKLQPQL